MASLEETLRTIVPDKITRAFMKFQATEMEAHFRAAFFLQVYSWPNLTRRQSGEIVGSPRNIVDLGGLVNSKQPVFFEDGGRTAVHIWTAPYATDNFLGGTIDGKFRPPRRWDLVALGMVQPGFITRNME